MTQKTPRSLKFKQFLMVSPAQVYSAFTTATALTEWLCQTAQVDPRPGGRVYMYWQNGYYTSGEFLSISTDRKLAFSWYGRNEPGRSFVKVSIMPKNEGTQIRLTHQGLGTGKAWKRTRKEFKKGWIDSLENLKSVLETGKDIRLLRQPMLGVFNLVDVLGSQAEALGLPQGGRGVRVEGVLDGLGAQTAGLEDGDVIVQFDGQHGSDLQSFLDFVRSHRAGDQIKLVYYRGGKRKKTTLELSHRPMLDVPPTAQELYAAGEKMFVECNDALRAALEGVTESAAEYHPKQEDWNIKQVLAHLISTECETHAWFTSMVEDQEAGFSFHVNSLLRLEALIAVHASLVDLTAELKKSQAETLALVARLPDEFIERKRTYYRLSSNLLLTSYHYQDHVAQIRSLAQAAQQAK